MPGAGAVGADFASVLSGAAARAVHHFLGAPGDGTNSAVEMQHALAAGGAFFRPHAAFLQNADERGVESGINRFAVESFRQGLHPRAAAERQHGVGVLDRLGGLFEEDVVALAFDGEFLDLEGAVLQFGRHAEGGGDDADFALAAGEADGHAGAAAEQEHLPVLLHDGQQFGYVFSLGDDHKIGS